ncbi:MAG: zinc ribbon domain-containing protein [Cenarchaeum sp. SB0661_bin_35]|nr:zinc ribbon domain-containing protein [Cenarchaeum sp. SB0662_bin_33]MYC79216.1 zinc ribbon domain-containing protein [Cenarchaeum sp. SB0661_bin_35]MYG33193.1 zinc ribbon domain-containing protein [Cenarchaeum sp. SB0677_bin_16]
MQAFDGKKAAQDYMSTNSMSYSTPELILNRFAFWLGDTVTNPDNKSEPTSRVMTYMTREVVEPPVVEDVYVPSGAVLNSLASHKVEDAPKFCPECGMKLSAKAKFCHQCGITQ